MGDFINRFAAQIKEAALIGVAFLAIIALAAACYAARTAFGPLAAVLAWLFDYKPEKPNDTVQGISFGARMLAWAVVVAVAVWLIYYWRCGS